MTSKLYTRAAPFTSSQIFAHKRSCKNISLIKECRSSALISSEDMQPKTTDRCTHTILSTPSPTNRYDYEKRINCRSVKNHYVKKITFLIDLLVINGSFARCKDVQTPPILFTNLYTRHARRLSMMNWQTSFFSALYVRSCGAK